MSDKEYIDCPRARSDMTPCVARDGSCAADDHGICVGCGHHPADLLRELVSKYIDVKRTAAELELQLETEKGGPLMEQLAAERMKTAAWKETIEGLTPGGSEFVDSPVACAIYIRDRMAYPRQVIELRTQVKELVEALDAALKDRDYHSDKLDLTEGKVAAIRAWLEGHIRAEEKNLEEQPGLIAGERKHVFCQALAALDAKEL